MSKIKNSGLDQYGAGPFEQQQFGTAGVEGVNTAPFLYSIFNDVSHILRCGTIRKSVMMFHFFEAISNDATSCSVSTRGSQSQEIGPSPRRSKADPDYS